MSLDVLFEDVFLNGCGISRKQALLSARYRELAATVPHVTHTTRQEVAEIIYLGERLADRAFQNLPKFYREQAKEWPAQSADERQATLDMIMMEFTSDSWKRKFSSRKEAMIRQIECALPLEYGSWQRGKEQPNCLGLAQMMVGFARATGEPFCLADTIWQSDQSTLQRTYVAMDWLVSQLDTFPESAQLQKKRHMVVKCRDDMLDSLVGFTNLQAHHAVAFVGDKACLIIDPYLGRRYQFRLSKRYERIIRNLEQANPRRHVTYQTSRTENRVDYILRAVTFVTDALKQAMTSAVNGDFYTVVYDAAFELVLAKPNPTADLAVKLVNQFVSDVVLARIPTNQRDNLTQEDVDQKFDWFDTRIRSRPKNYEFALRRLLVSVVNQALIALYDLQSDPEVEHPVIELHPATYHLAVMTLNHRAGQLGVPAGDLVRFSSGQFLLRDILTEVRGAGSTKHQVILSTRLRAFARPEAESIVMPEIRANLSVG